MSFARVIYGSGLLGAWAAFFAWLFCEVVFGRWLSSETWGVPLAILMGTLVASAIGGGISQASGLVNFRWQEQLIRLGFGVVGGFIAGLIGSTIGNLVFWLIGGGNYTWEGTSTVVLEIPQAAVGEWPCTITALYLPYENFPFVVTVGEKK